MTAATAKQFVIEDRTQHKPGTSFAGRFVLFRICGRPFPHRLYVSHFATRREALAGRRFLLKGGAA